MLQPKRRKYRKNKKAVILELLRVVARCPLAILV